MASFRREWAAHPLMSLKTSDPRMREMLRAMIMRYPGNDLAEPDVIAGMSGASAPLGSIDLPVLLITGDQDLPSRNQAADQLAAQWARAERAVIAGAGHLPNLDNPKGYNAVVRTFLERHATSRG